MSAEGFGSICGLRSDNSAWQWGINVLNQDVYTAVPQSVNCGQLDIVDVISDDNEYVLYPNPMSDWLNIQIPLNKALEEVEVTDQSGRVVKRFTGSKVRIDLSNLASGLYYLNLISNGEGKLEKIVKR